MAQAFDGIASDVEHLTERLGELERRVAALEVQRETPGPAQPELTTRTMQKGAAPRCGGNANRASAGSR